LSIGGPQISQPKSSHASVHHHKNDNIAFSDADAKMFDRKSDSRDGRGKNDKFPKTADQRVTENFTIAVYTN